MRVAPSIRPLLGRLLNKAKYPCLLSRTGAPRVLSTSTFDLPRADCVMFEDIVRAHHRIRSGIVRTPCESSHWLSKETGCNIYLKTEQLQVVLASGPRERLLPAAADPWPFRCTTVHRQLQGTWRQECYPLALAGGAQQGCNRRVGREPRTGARVARSAARCASDGGHADCRSDDQGSHT
jgi:hypothetical protein